MLSQLRVRISQLQNIYATDLVLQTHAYLFGFRAFLEQDNQVTACLVLVMH